MWWGHHCWSRKINVCDNLWMATRTACLWMTESGVLCCETLFCGLTGDSVPTTRRAEFASSIQQFLGKAARGPHPGNVFGIAVPGKLALGDPHPVTSTFTLGMQMHRDRVSARRLDVRLGHADDALVEAGTAGLLIAATTSPADTEPNSLPESAAACTGSEMAPRASMAA